MMEQWSIFPTTINSSSEAIRELKEAQAISSPYNVAVIDMQMPEVSGIELAKKIKDSSHIKDTKLILLTEMTGQSDTSKFEEIGFKAFVRKPVNKLHLFNAISLTLGHIAPEQLPTNLMQAQMEEKAPEIKLSVLLVEDNVINQTVAKLTLQKLGYDTEVASNGSNAIEMLKDKKYDLVLMDMQMPVMGGVEATKIIRSDESMTLNGQVPIIAMTANAMKSDRDLCIESGMNDYISKPIKAESINQVLNRWINITRKKEVA